MSISLKSLGLAVAVGIGALLPASGFAQELLSIGSDAPKLNIEHWVSDGNGKFEPVTEFESGKVYVVEFWATWCGPCVMSMPHLVELQEQFGDKGVQIISISDEDLDTVNGFLDRKVQGDEEGRTYRQLTSAYCLTTDPDNSSQTEYMQAAGQNGIPTAFVVGKDAKIEWIGHPMELDDVLTKVVEGTWDREAQIASFKAQQEFDAVMGEIFGLAQSGNIDGAIKLLQEKSANIQDASLKQQIGFLMLNLLANAEGKQAEFAAHATQLLKDAEGDLMTTLNVGFMVHSAIEAGTIENAELVKTVRGELEKLTEFEDARMKSFTYLVRAYLQRHDGDIAAAKATVAEAMEFAPEEIKGEFESLKAMLDAQN